MKLLDKDKLHELAIVALNKCDTYSSIEQVTKDTFDAYLKSLTILIEINDNLQEELRKKATDEFYTR